jgi:hypothetical protein
VGSGLTAGLTAGAGAALSGASGTLGRIFGTGDWRSAAGHAAVNSLTGHAGARLAGLDNSFSWRNVAASAVTASLTSSAAGRLGRAMHIDLTTAQGQFAQDLLGGAVGGVVGIHTRRAAGLDQRVDYGQVAADAFGNALANGLTGEHSRQALKALEAQHRSELIHDELAGRLARGDLHGQARADALRALGLPSDPRRHDGLWDRLPEDGSRIRLAARQGRNPNGTAWFEEDWARRINDSYERERFGGARVDFNTIRTDGVRDRRAAQVEVMPIFRAAPAHSWVWSMAHQVNLYGARGAGAAVGMGKMAVDGVVDTLSFSHTFAQAGMYQFGIAGMLDRFQGGNSYTMAGLAAGDRIGADIQGFLDFASADNKGQMIAGAVSGRFNSAMAKLSSDDPSIAYSGGMEFGQLFGEGVTAAAGGYQLVRGGVGFARRTGSNFVELSQGKLYSIDGALGDLGTAMWRALRGKHPDIDPGHLRLLTDGKDAHALSRHGGAVTDDQLIVRARTGYTLDKQWKRIPEISSAFHSDRLLAQADSFVRSSGRLQAALSRGELEFRIDIKTMPEFQDLGIDLGRGYAAVHKGNANVVGSLQGPLNRIDSLRGVSGHYVYDQASKRWLTHTLYPNRG